MTIHSRPPAPAGNMNTWAERLNDWIMRNRSKLAYYLAGQSAAEEGIILWDRDNSRVIVSDGGQWVELGTGGAQQITNYLRDDADDSTAFRLTMAALTVDTDTLYVDETNNRVGIGTTTPSQLLDVDGTAKATAFDGSLKGKVVFTAEAAENIVKGMAVYISGFANGNTTVGAAKNDESAKMPALGLAAATVSSGDALEVITHGEITGLNTASLTVGSILYVSDTAGNLTDNVPPAESKTAQAVGVLTKSDGTDGRILVTGPEQAHNVKNLDDGNIFIGNASGEPVTASLATKVSALETSHTDVLVDGDFTSQGFMKTDGSGGYSVDTNTYLTSETSHADVLVDGDFSSAGFMKTDGNGVYSVDSSTYLTSETSHADVVVDGDFTSEGLMKRGATDGSYSIVTDNSSNWDAAHGWGNHATAGYLTSQPWASTTNNSITFLYYNSNPVAIGSTTIPDNTEMYVASTQTDTLTIENTGNGLYDKARLSLIGQAGGEIFFSDDDNAVDFRIRATNGGFAIRTETEGSGGSVSYASLIDASNGAGHIGIGGTSDASYTLKVNGNLYAGGVAFPSADGNADEVLKTDGAGALSYSSITTSMIGNQQVTGAKIAANTIASGNLLDGGVPFSKLYDVKDEDDMASNSASHICTQQSIRNFVVESVHRQYFANNNVSQSLTTTPQTVWEGFSTTATNTKKAHFATFEFQCTSGSSTFRNDAYFYVEVNVPSVTTSFSLGTATYESAPAQYGRIISFAGDITDKLSDGGAIGLNANSSGYFGDRSVESFYYDSGDNKTYLRYNSYPSDIVSSGTPVEVFFDPFHWQSSSTHFLETYQLELPYSQQNGYFNITSKLGYFSPSTEFRLKAREINSGDVWTVNTLRVTLESRVV
jgi:hypothetical protein